MTPRLSRRGLFASFASAGAWHLGWAAGAEPPAAGFGVWLRFGVQELTLLTPISDVGQGTSGLLAAIAAEELGLPMSRIRVEQAPVEPRFHNPFTQSQVTYGSIGFRTAYATLAPACAAARDMLLRAAAQRWGVAAGECRATDGQVRHDASGRQAALLSLAPEAARMVPPQRPVPVPPAQWQVLGRRHPRTDIPAKTRGQAVFGIDVQPRGVLHAAVLHGPGFGAVPSDLDERPARATPGVRAVLRLPAAVAVVAESYWTAEQALRRLRPRWKEGPYPALDSTAHARELLAAAAAGDGRDFPARLDPRLDGPRCAGALDGAAQVVEHQFEFPFLAHAPMEPLGATVHLREDGAEAWVSTQAPSETQAAVARTLGLPAQKVVLHGLPCGGGFGRRLEVDAAVEAALIARALGPGRPVKLIRSREADLRAGYYRPAGAVRVRLGLGADGLPTALRADLAGSRIEDYSAVAGPPQPDLPDQASAMGWLEPSYALPVLHLTFARVDRAVPVGYWRSVGASQNCFALETVVEVAARRAGVDGMAYRRRLLAGEAPRQRRALALLDSLAARCGWGQPLPAGHHRGVALSEANRAVCGHVVEVAVDRPGRFRIVKIWAAIDAGWVGHPDAVEAQLMGGTLWGLGAALFGEITFEQGRVVQGNFDTCRLLQLRETPPMDLLVLGQGDRPAGVGEEAVPSIAPALGNALLAASDQPVSRLPFTRAGWSMIQ